VVEHHLAVGIMTTQIRETDEEGPGIVLRGLARRYRKELREALRKLEHDANRETPHQKQ
jgi:hypothetical protein